jgi:hypothetical protein
MSNGACSPVDERREIVARPGQVAGLTLVHDMHYIACSIMHELDLVRGQGNDTNGDHINADNAGRGDVAGAKGQRDAERGG